MCDGTFKSATSNSFQIFTIHCEIFRKARSICYAYLKSKTKETYIKLFNKLKELVGNFKLEEDILDFEQSIYLDLKKCFENVKISYCLFHFGQIIYRNIQKNGFQNLYKTDLRFDNDKR
jgi:hypothetical protein